MMNQKQTSQNVKTWPDGQALKKVKDVAKHLGVHPNTVYNWLAAGELECVRLPSNKLAFTFDQVESFIEDRRNRREVNVNLLSAA